MILSDQDIKRSIDFGEVKITPFDQNCIRPASYIFHLGYKILRPKTCEVIDLKNNIIPEYEEIELSEIGYKLMPEDFILGQTLETLSLNKNTAMIIEGRSALARSGIEVTQTSTFIEPDHTDSIITLEIKNDAKTPVMLYPRMEFAKGIFHSLTSSSTGEFSNSTYSSSAKPQNKVMPPQNLI